MYDNYVHSPNICLIVVLDVYLLKQFGTNWCATHSVAYKCNGSSASPYLHPYLLVSS